MIKVIYLGPDIGFQALVDELDGRATVEHIEASPEPLAEALLDAHALLDASMKVRITNDMLGKAEKLNRGEIDGSNGYMVKADCYNVPINKLRNYMRRK